MYLRRYLALLALTFMVSCLDLRCAVYQALHLEKCSAMPGSAEPLTTLLANLVLGMGLPPYTSYLNIPFAVV